MPGFDFLESTPFLLPESNRCFTGVDDLGDGGVMGLNNDRC